MELLAINLILNTSKCVSLRIGLRYEKSCCPIVSTSGKCINWVTELRYLGVYVLNGKKFRCSFHTAKCKFNRAVNSVLSKTLGVVSEEVILYLIKTKCLPVLLYAAEVCDLNIATIRSFDFFTVRFAMKIFRSSNREFVGSVLRNMSFELPSALLPLRLAKFIQNVKKIDNILVNLYQH